MQTNKQDKRDGSLCRRAKSPSRDTKTPVYSSLSPIFFIFQSSSSLCLSISFTHPCFLALPLLLFSCFSHFSPLFLDRCLKAKRNFNFSFTETSGSFLCFTKQKLKRDREGVSIPVFGVLHCFPANSGLSKRVLVTLRDE